MKVLVVLPVKEHHKELFLKSAPKAEFIYEDASKVTKDAVLTNATGAYPFSGQIFPAFFTFFQLISYFQPVCFLLWQIKVMDLVFYLLCASPGWRYVNFKNCFCRYFDSIGGFICLYFIFKE